MFVDLMNDIYNTFSDRFLKVQLQFGPPPPMSGGGRDRDGDGGGPDGPRRGPDGPRRPAPRQRRYNALGVLEEVPVEEVAGNGDGDGAGEGDAIDISPAEPPQKETVVKRDPVIVGAGGRTRSLSEAARPSGGATPADWSNVGRNDPCPCGSGKKYKKCHGAA